MRISIASGDRSSLAKAIAATRALEPERTGLHLSSIIRDIQECSAQGNGRTRAISVRWVVA
jgi:hypothetical protein